MKTLRYLILQVFALCITLQTGAQESIRYLSLAQACRLASDSNLLVINAQLDIRKSLYHLNETKSQLYPQIEGYSDLNYYYKIPKMILPGEFFGTTGEIAVEIGTKYDWSSGFKASLSLLNLSCYTSIKLAKSLQNISELNLEQKREEIVYQVSQVYNLCISTRSQISYLEKNMNNNNRLLEILKSQIESGIARKIDNSKVLVTKNNLQTQIDNLTKLMDQQTNLLKYLTGLNLNTKINLTDSLSIANIPINIDLSSFKNRVDAKLLDKQIEIAVLNKKTIGLSYIPSLSASGQFYYQGQQNEFSFFKGNNQFFNVGFIGFNLSVPIFDGFEKHSKSRQYTIEIRQLQNTRENITEGYHKDYLDAINQYNNSLKTVARQQENIRVAEDDYSISLQQYRQQVIPLSDLMLSENSLTEARLAFVDAMFQLKNAELGVKKLKGELLKF